MKPILYHILLIINLLFCNAVVYSQDVPTLPGIVPVSPEAAGIAKYVNYPVSHSTGLVNIEIPLYEIRSGDIVLPITLSYHTSGLKVNESSGIAGSGWTLNAEPSITRSIQGWPDFGNLITADANCNFTNIQLKGLADAPSGGAPDHFYYKLPHQSGAFYFRKLCGSSAPPGIVVIPYEPLRIRYLSTGSLFVITDANGIQYNFGDNPDYLEYSGTSMGNMHATTFKASSIRSASTGGEITFGYRPAQETCPNLVDGIIVADAYKTTSLYTSCTVPEGLMGVDGLLCFPYITTTVEGAAGWGKVYDLDADNQLTDHGYISEAPYVTMGDAVSTIDRKLIERIDFDQGSVTFGYQGNDRLETITVKDKNNVVIRRISLEQTPFYAISDKHKLDALRITDHHGNILEEYWFDYYNPGNVPLKHSKRVDHWGYSNGAPIPIMNNNYEYVDASRSMCAIPRHLIDLVKQQGDTVQVYIGEADREPDEEYMKSGILTGIQYSTGAYKKFFYESNLFDRDGIIGMAGGLRIEHVEDYDPVTNQTLIARYSYGVGESGVGYIKHIPSMDDYVVERTRRYEDNRTVRMRTYSSWAIPDLFRSGGPPVIYECVTEYKETDYQTTRTVYRYKAVNDTWSYRDITCPFSYHYNDGWSLGHLVEKSVFDSETQAVVESYACSYQTFRDYMEDVYIFNAYYAEEYAYPPKTPDFPNSPPNTPPITLFTSHIRSGCIRKVSETMTKDGVTSQVDYQYDNLTHMYPTRITRSNSNGVATIEELTYPMDNIALTGDALMAKNQLITQWKINTLLRRRVAQGGQSKTVQTDYAVTGDHVLPSVVKTSFNNEPSENRVLHRKYDAYGNPVYLSYGEGPGMVYLWGYNYQQPVARIENASYDEVKGILGEPFINGIARATTPSSHDLGTIRNLRTQLPDAMVTVYEYKPLVGVVAVTDPSGRTVHYDYDTFGRLIQVSDDNDIQQMFEYRKYEFP